jgi:hypothetical protein
MQNHVRRTSAALGAVVAASTALVLALPLDTAGAATRPASRITVHTSDATPGSGQEFVLTGRLTSPTGRALAGGAVRVQTLRGGEWTNLSGAHVSTGSDGRYRVRVILSQRGERDLRVVGDPAGQRLRTDRARIDVTVS